MGNKTIHHKLRRDLVLSGAIMMGLGSILGTGVFVSIGVAAGVTGPSVVFAIILAALVASCNALSSAQLAASHPVSGGTYEYGYRYLHPALGFTAGWMFLCAKTASAATAALGFAGYFLHLLGFPEVSSIPVAVSVVLIVTLIVLSGIRRSNQGNLIIVSITLLSLVIFVLFGISPLLKYGGQHLSPFFPKATAHGFHDFCYATALMFVAYTGYGRIATLGEEVKTPARTIPKAIVVTLLVSAVIYTLVAVVAIALVGSEQLASTTESRATPLEIAARAMNQPGLPTLIALGACTAMLGVLLNLILGLSRVALAMGRQQDLPEYFAAVSPTLRTPVAAVVGIGLSIAALSAFASVETTWSFSAFTVLIYYSITNLAALYLPKKQRLYPNVIALTGLISCVFLAFWVPLDIWLSGIMLIVLGLLWHRFHRYYLKGQGKGEY
ncbi:MAG: amino acid permease [Legionellaceae bacterium]|nr:amino acid permease [Legionellaceae bacterium]